LYVGVSRGGQNLTKAHSKRQRRQEGFPASFEDMNSTFRANDHSFQQKKKASKFLKATLQKTLSYALMKKFIDC